MEFLEGNMCRLCLRKKDLLDLFIPESSDTLCDMLTTCTSIELKKDDGFPPYICVHCTQSLEQAYHFKNRSEKSDKILRTDYIQNSYGRLEPYEMPTDLDYDDVMAACEVKLDCEDINTFDSKHNMTNKNKIVFEQASDLKKKISSFLNIDSKSTRNRRKDLMTKILNNLKTKTNLTIRKVSNINKDIVKKEIDYDSSGSDDKFDINDYNDDESDDEDTEYVPVKVSKANKGTRVKTKYSTKVRKHMIPIKNRPKYQKMTRNLESRFKIMPKIIQLSKYKNCTTSNKGPYKDINGRIVKIYRTKHTMRDGSGRRGRKPVLDRDESGRIIRQKYQCCVCGLMTADIKQHMTSHTGEKSHVCDVCDRRFSTRGNLIHHKKIHSGVKSHVCQVCGAAFIYASCLQRHLDIHTGTKPHKCHLCDKAFQLAQGLKRHLTVHEGARPHACHMCPARFNQPHQLKTHIRSHTGEKPYVCQECGEAFTYKYVLNNHVKKHAAVRLEVAPPPPPPTQQLVLSSLHNVQHGVPHIMPVHNVMHSANGLVGLVQANLAMGQPVCSQ